MESYLDWGRGHVGGEGIKPRLKPPALNPEGSKTVRWADKLEDVIDSDEGDDDDIAELTMPAAGEGDVWETGTGGRPGNAPENPPPSGRWIGARILELL